LKASGPARIDKRGRREGEKIRKGKGRSEDDKSHPKERGREEGGSGAETPH